MKVKSESEVAQLCPILCDPLDCRPPGSSVHGILQARILEWVAISVSRLIKLTKNKHKERILKAVREKQQVAYKGNPICLTADLSTSTQQTRRDWQDVFKVLKRKNLQPRLLARISFKIDGEIKRFSDNQCYENSGPSNQLYNKL